MWAATSLTPPDVPGQVCSADLAVPVLHGAVIEAAATLVCRLGSRLIAAKEPQVGELQLCTSKLQFHPS